MSCLKYDLGHNTKSMKYNKSTINTAGISLIEASLSEPHTNIVMLHAQINNISLVVTITYCKILTSVSQTDVMIFTELL